MKPKFSMLIRWSDDDDCYVVYVPELDVACGHGDTYEEAAAHAKEALEGYIEGTPPAERLPDPLLYGEKHTIEPPVKPKKPAAAA
ncbi:MAG: type II toxin-antitoxin system HicB family antitoxin [Planctomycetota bacterium]